MSYNFWYLSINKIDNLLRKQGKKEVTKIATTVLLIIEMPIRPTRLLKNNVFIIIYDVNMRLLGENVVVN